MANSILSTVEVDMDLRSIVLRLGRYRILLECRSLYPLSSDLCIFDQKNNTKNIYILIPPYLPYFFQTVTGNKQFLF